MRFLKLTCRSFVLVAAFCAVLGAAGSKDGLWSLRPVVRPDTPARFSSEKNPIDAFVKQAQADKALRSVGKADKATLLRRVYLDLIGLPPSPDETRAFLQDNGPDAYE